MIWERGDRWRFVEGMNKTIRVTQQRCVALGDEKLLRLLKVLIGMVNGSEHGRWALDWVAQLPFVKRPRVTVVHVMDTTTLRVPFLPVSVVASEKTYLQEEMDRMEARSAQIMSAIKQQLAAL